MKKKDLLSIAMMGVCAGLLMGACQAPANNNQRGMYSNGDAETQNFYRMLSPEYQRKFDQLDARGRANAMQMYRDNGSRDANRAVDMTVRGQRSKMGQAEVPAEKSEVAATTAPVENKSAAPVEAEKIENKVSSATSTATTTVQ